MQTQNNDLNILLPDSFGNWQKTSEDEVFDHDNLHDYLNGGAELYISYDFSRVIKRTYSAPEQPEITIDIFDMQNSKNAYGVFTHSSEKSNAEYGQGAFQVEGAILFWKDRYYISIIVFPETEESKNAIEKLADIVSNSIKSEGDIPPIVNLLPRENLINESILYFRHYNWLNSYYHVSFENILNITNDTECAFAKYNTVSGGSILLILEYKSEYEAGLANENFESNYYGGISSKKSIHKMEDGSWSGSRVVNNYIIIVFNTRENDRLISLLNKSEKLILKSISEN